LLLKFGRTGDIDWDKLSLHFSEQELSSLLLKTFYTQKLWSTNLSNVLVNNLTAEEAAHAQAIECWQFLLREHPLDTCMFIAMGSEFFTKICAKPNSANLKLLYLFF